MAIEQDLDQLEKGIRQLQIEWEKFFGGVEKRPPIDLKTRIERLTREHDLGEIRNNVLRFRYQTLVARYNTFNELWQKRLRAMEEGRPAAGMRAAPPPPPPPAEPSAAEDGSPLADLLEMPLGRGGARPVSRPRPGEGMRVADPARDRETVQLLYQQFLEERRRTGESANVKFDSFQKLITQQASRILAEKGATAVDFRLETKDGKVSLKARPVK